MSLLSDGYPGGILRMRVIFGINRIKKLKRAVVALGVFDGVHTAHRLILAAARKKAGRIAGTSVAFTFWPHPQKEVSIYSLEHRLRLIASCGIDVCIVARFSRYLSGLSPQGFVKDILVDRLGARYLYVGENFRFGNRARGDLRLLKRLAGVYNFQVRAFAVLRSKGMSISSTGIRRLITRGELKKAEGLLGRPVNIMGTVVRGSSVAGRLGFPTANINPHHEVMPPAGVYAVRVLWKKKRLQGVCNIGVRPTFGGKNGKRVEVHIFHFNRNLYGECLQIEFLKRIRKEKKFASPASLAEQIKKDCLRAKKIFAHH